MKKQYNEYLDNDNTPGVFGREEVKSFEYAGNNLEGNVKTESDNMISRQWSFKYEFGCVYVESWGKPFLVLTCHSYSNWGESWGYNYEKTGMEFDNVGECQQYANELNYKYSFPRYFNFSIKVSDLDIVDCPVLA